MELLFVIDSNPVIFVFISIFFLLFYADYRTLTRVSDVAYLLFSLLALVIVRLPVTLTNREFNVDESQMLTQAHTLWYYPVFWEYVDGTTSGPLNSYALFIGRIITGNFDYISARVTGIVLILITLAALYYALKLLFGVFPARLSTSLIVLFYAFNQVPDLVHFSSETVPLALISLSLWLLAVIWKGNSRFAHGFWLGFALMLIPFGKLQALPIAFFLGCFCLLICFSTGLTKQAAGLVAGTLSVLLVVAALLSAGGLWQDFWNYYIQGNLLYGREFSLEEAILFSKRGLLHSEAMLVLLLLTTMFFVVSRIYGRRERNTRFMGAFLALLLLVSVFCIVKPGWYFVHYYLLLIPAVAFIAADSFRSLSGAINEKSLPKVRIIWGAAAFLMGANLWFFNLVNHKTLNRYALPYPLQQKAPVKEILKYTKPGDFLAIWGWWPDGYVQTGTIQATAENHAVRGLMENSLSPLYIERYVRNLTRSRPPVFVDPVGSSYNFPFVHRSDYFEQVPPVKEYIEKHYEHVKTVEDVRIFLRKDLVR